MSDIDKTLGDEAYGIVTGARREKYGPPERNFRRIALAWEALTDRAYTEAEVGLMMAAMKLVREANVHQRDNIVDGMGYLYAVDAVTPKPITDDERRSIGINPVADPSGRLAAIAKSHADEAEINDCIDARCSWYCLSVDVDHVHDTVNAVHWGGRYASSFATHPAAEKLMG